MRSNGDEVRQTSKEYKPWFEQQYGICQSMASANQQNVGGRGRLRGANGEWKSEPTITGRRIILTHCHDSLSED